MESSASRRILLERYLRGELPKAAKVKEQTGQGRVASVQAPPGPDSLAPIVTIQASGNRTPFFFPHVHWQGGATYCFTLAHELGPDQPFYVVEPYRFDGLQVPPDLQQIAAECIKSVQTIQPEGPYRLGGYCGSGFILFEMAQQLYAAGQHVETLIMIEPGVGPYFAPLLGWAGKGLRSVGTRLGFRPEQQLAWFLHLRHLYKAVRYPAYRHEHGLSRAPGVNTLRKDWMAVFVWIVSAYVPHPYPGKVTYLRARKSRGSQRNWWCRTFVAHEAEVHYIAGTRSNCRSNYVHDQATHLRQCLIAP
jgi:hypothetical protein